MGSTRKVSSKFVPHCTKLILDCSHGIEHTYVSAHAGDPCNELADYLCRALQKGQLPYRSIVSHTIQWDKEIPFRKYILEEKILHLISTSVLSK